MMWMMSPSLLWLAFGGIEPASADDRFEPMHHADLVGLQDANFDSGWVPMDSPVQLRLTVHAADSVDIEMPGTATYDWPSETLAVSGDVDEGWLSLDVGIQIHAEVRFDVAGIQWQSDVLGPWDYAIVAEASFTPYLLPGDPQAPVSIADQTDGVTVASVPIVPNIVVASGNLDIDVSADIEADLSGVSVQLATADLNTGQIDAADQAALLPADPGSDPLLVDGVMIASLQTRPTLIVRPHLVMSILGQDFDIAGIDLPITLPETDGDVVFEPEAMSFAAPPPPPPAPGDGSGGSASGTGGDDGLDGSSDSAGGEDSSSTGADTDDGLGQAESGDGCGCRSGRRASGAPWLLLLAPWIVRRRRRRRTQG
jgi:hypothetical protein